MKYDELLLGENTEWHHGFNSGMLACLWLVSCARIYPNNMEDFPVLDTQKRICKTSNNRKW